MEKSTKLSNSLVFLVSSKGGNNYWGRLINNCTKLYTPGEGTLSISVTNRGYYVLRCNNLLFDAWDAALQKLVLIHEASHIALRHVERLVRLMMDVENDPITKAAIIAVFNYAADFVANDQILRKEEEFSRCHVPRERMLERTKDKVPLASHEWCFLLPEEYGFPKDLTMEQYVQLLLADLDKFAKEVTNEWKRQAIDDCNSEKNPEEREKKKKEWEEKIGEPLDDVLNQDASENTPGDTGGEGDTEGDDNGGQGGQKSTTNPDKSGKGSGSSDTPNHAEAADSDGLSGITQTIKRMARSDSGLFENLAQAFGDLTRQNHKDWNQIAKDVEGDVARSLADKIKKQTQRIVRQAHNITKRDRGTVPAWIETLVQGLLEDDPTPWDVVFGDVVGTAITAKVIEAVQMPSPNLINEMWLEPYPGYTMDTGFNIVWYDDTSGSMGDGEYARGCARMSQLLEQHRQVTCWRVQGDAAIQKVFPSVTNVTPLSDEEREAFSTRHGHGGTSYKPFFRWLAKADQPADWIHPSVKPEETAPEPDLIIIVTDGGVILEGECFPDYRPNCPIVWLLMPGCHAPAGMDGPNDRLIQMFPIKNDLDD